MTRLNAILQYVRIKHGTHKSVTAKIVDSCPSCKRDHLGEYRNMGKSASFLSLIGFSLVDLSPATFKRLAPLSKGSIEIEWEYI